MKKLIFSIILYAFYIAPPSGAGGAYAQSTEIRPGSVLPQMTTAQRTALAAVNGMLVFDTNTQSNWSFQSGTWVNLTASGGTNSGVPLSGIILSEIEDNPSLLAAGFQKNGLVNLNVSPLSSLPLWSNAINTYDPTTISQMNAQYGHSALWTGSKMLIFGGGDQTSNTTLNSGFLYEPISNTTKQISLTNAPQERSGHVAVWTGSKMIVWGGIYAGSLSGPIYAKGGGIYDLKANTWDSIAVFPHDVNPQQRGYSGSSAVWTGTEMIVWGGNYYNYPISAGGNRANGARYNPVSNSWTVTSSTNAPSARTKHCALWTGSKMIVWGGYLGPGNSNSTTTGAVFDPVTDSWTSMSMTNAPANFEPQTAIWTGTEMIVYAFGQSVQKFLYKYNPVTNTWTQSSSFFYPHFFEKFTTVFTGKKIIYFGGASTYNASSLGYGTRGDVYDVTTDTFDTNNNNLLLTAAPPNTNAGYGYGHTAVWTGHQMIVYGNKIGHILNLNYGLPEPKPMFLYKKN